MTDTRDIVLSAPRPTSTGLAGRNVVVVIGIDHYAHWDSLHNAVSDADGARKLFLGLGFEEVVPPLRNDAATRAALEALVNDELATLRPSDSLVLFYAGHGGTRTVERNGKAIRTGHLIPVDAATERVSTWIDLEAWLRAVSLLPPRHILVILDACFSGIALGPVIKWRGGEATPTEPLATLQARSSRRIITSALDNERALDSGPVDGHSLFTGALIEALTGGIASTAGAVTGSELAIWVRRRVRTYPKAQQTPDFGAFDHDERGEIAIPLLLRPDRGSSAGDDPQTRPTSESPRAAIEHAPSDPGVVIPVATSRRRSRRVRRWYLVLRRERDWLLIVVSLLAVAVVTAIARSC